MTQNLKIEGASQNNLKGIDIELPHDEFVVFAGLSGSGKSSLAFSTIYAEGARRYIETFSPYTRQFLDKIKPPMVDKVSNLRPALALEQRKSNFGARSTVGTTTEINDFLKVVWAKRSKFKCPSCNVFIDHHTPLTISTQISQKAKDLVYICFRVALKEGVEVSSYVEALEISGFSRAFVPGRGVVRFSQLYEGKIKINENLYVLVQRVNLKNKNSEDQSGIIKKLSGAIAECLQYSKSGTEIFYSEEDQESDTYFSGFLCKGCGTTQRAASESLFSFNSPIGACIECKGFGKILLPDIDLVIPNQNLSIEENCISIWSGKLAGNLRSALKRYCKERSINTKIPWRDIPNEQRRGIIHGVCSKTRFKGIFPWFKTLERKLYKTHIRVFMSRYRSEHTCPSCTGRRLKGQAFCYEVNGEIISNVWNYSIEKLEQFFLSLPISKDDPDYLAVCEVKIRLSYLKQVGLSYLTLNRQMKTLSGGEAQRVNLTSVLGSELVNTIVVLDEPSIGLHAKDTSLLVDIIKKIVSVGNSVYVVEHDPSLIRESSRLIEFGLGSGSSGGEVIYNGSTVGSPYLERITNLKVGSRLIQKNKKERLKKKSLITVKGAKANNLKNVDISFLKNTFNVLVGVSGSGKSTLIEECLVNTGVKSLGYPNYFKEVVTKSCKSISGLEDVDEIIHIDQTPLGKSSRSNVATYCGFWDEVRERFGEAGSDKGLTKSDFSFNTDGGRCAECKGAGEIKIEMQFLSDVYVTCEKCNGERFIDKVLDVEISGVNIIDILKMDINEFQEFCERVGSYASFSKKLKDKIEILKKLGLDYLTLGHSLNSLSGGEAQRLKLVRYLESKLSPKKNTKLKVNANSVDNRLIILDEPTTGLSSENIISLSKVLEELVSAGNTLIVIEHNLDMICSASYLSELGSEGGEKGGYLVAEGFVSDLIKDESLQTPTLIELRKYLEEENKQEGVFETSIVPQNKVPKKADNINVINAYHHNLKNINVEIPKNKIVCICGVSGSGKSSLVFGILFSEGQRRFIDCLSPYARQFIKNLSRPGVDQVLSIPPTISVSQGSARGLGVSTVGTVTESYHYLRLLFSKLGTQHCPGHLLPLTSGDTESVISRIKEKYSNKKIEIYAPVVNGRKGDYNALFRKVLKSEIREAYVDGEKTSITEDLRLEKSKIHWISVKIGTINCGKNSELLEEAVKLGLKLSGDELKVREIGKTKFQLFSRKRVCPKCDKSFKLPDPLVFSFRSKRGSCSSCKGSGLTATGWVCKKCCGSRLCSLASTVKINDYTIFELSSLSILKIEEFISNLKFSSNEDAIFLPIKDELIGKLKALSQLGLGELTLNRDASTLSGGEMQRLRLAKVLGSNLSGVCYIFDEPSIGLHPEDQKPLKEIFEELKSRNNTVILVEHDEDIILNSDYLLEFGPGGGNLGGNLVFSGSPKDLLKSSESKTAEELRRRGQKFIPPIKEPATTNDIISVTGVCLNNLKDIDVNFIKGKINVVCGVSAAGKSSLVNGVLFDGVISILNKDKLPKYVNSIEGLDGIERVIQVDQSPIGRSSSSTPISYLKIWDSIRDLYSSTNEAKVAGFNKSHFSFNSGTGRCDFCKGKGQVKIPMTFLPDSFSMCDVCEGIRFKPEVLDVQYKGISIGQLLTLTIEQARNLFKNFRKIYSPLELMCELGLGYLTLGQSSTSLSGGEAQRIKLVRELGVRSKVNNLYILDEPTIGLHMSDINLLITALTKLASMGNTIVLIEHNADIIKSADQIIEMGPVGGEKGGFVQYCGTLQNFVDSKTLTSKSIF